ncbi:hypothetical protein Hanom_Chr05g00387101 [Helianthus anomalus]
MSSSYSSNTSQSHKPRIFSVDLEGNVYCHHYWLAVRRVAGLRSSRAGHEFYRLWMSTLACEFSNPFFNFSILATDNIIN